MGTRTGIDGTLPYYIYIYIACVRLSYFVGFSSAKNMCLKKEFEVQCAVVLSSNIVCVLFLLSKPFGSNKQDLLLNTLPTIIFAGAMLLNFVDVSPD